MVRRLLNIKLWMIVAFAASPVFSKRYIVRAKPVLKSNNRAKNSLVRSLAFSTTENKIQSIRGVRKVQALKKTQAFIVDSDDSRMKDELIAEGYTVEEDKIIYLADIHSDAPSSTGLYQNPWLDDVLELGDQSAPDITINSAGYAKVIVAVVDTGIDISNPYLAPIINNNSGEIDGDGIDNDGNGYIDDKYGVDMTIGRGSALEDSSTDHGSHVAGLVKAVRDQAIPNYPKARGIELLPVRFINGSGNGSTSGAILSLEYAAQRGAKVINMSWGSGGVSSFSQALYETCASLYQNHDIAMVAAAGNDGNNNDNNPYFPSSFNIPGLASVAALAPRYSFGGSYYGNSMAYFSNTGASSVKIAAPGHVIVGGIESGVHSANGQYSNDGYRYALKSGTSMAAPVVAGIVAVVRAINPSLTSYESLKVIYDSSEHDSATNNKTTYGLARADSAFQDAESAVSGGIRPSVSSQKYLATSYREPASTRGLDFNTGGCGLVLPVGGSDNDEGPFGGNSVLLLMGAYMLFVLFSRKRDSLFS